MAEDLMVLVTDWRENSAYALSTGDVGAARAWDRAADELEAKIASLA